MLRRTRALLPTGVSPVPKRYATLYLRVINIAGQGPPSGATRFEQRPRDMRAYEEGMENLALAMPEVLAAPDMLGNGRAAAGRVYQAQLARRLVQSPTLREADRLTAAEMATLAFLADIDPYYQDLGAACAAAP